MTLLTSSLVDRKEADIRLEAAMSKLWGTEATWHIVDETMQIRGGRGYETAQSLAARGENPIPVERLMRDCRINLIFEGSSEIMRLFIAREALDPHLRLGATIINPKAPMAERIKVAAKASKFYAGWYAKQWWPLGVGVPAGLDHRLAPHACYVGKTSRRLARTLFHQIIWHGPKLEREQMLLGRLINIGTELFAMAATCSKAQAVLAHGGDRNETLTLVDSFCKESRLRIKHEFQGVTENNDQHGYRLARQILSGKYEWLEEGIVAR